MARRQARELAFRTLFQAERGKINVAEVWAQIRDDLTQAQADELDEVFGPPLDSEDLAFAESLVHYYVAEQQSIDDELNDVIEGWTFSQMAQTDLTILRLALCELRAHKDIPLEVTLEIAVRIAKKYGGEESGRFVNGVLARYVRSLVN